MTFNFYRWTSLFYGDHDEKPKVGSQESLDTHLHMQDTVSYLPFIAYRVRVMAFNGTFNNLSVISLRPVLLMEKTKDLPQITDKLCHIMFYRPQTHGAWISFPPPPFSLLPPPFFFKIFI